MARLFDYGVSSHTETIQTGLPSVDIGCGTLFETLLILIALGSKRNQNE